MAEWITSKQLAEELQVTDRTIRYWTATGDLPSRRLGRQYRFRRDEVEAWLTTKSISKAPQQAWDWKVQLQHPQRAAPRKAAPEAGNELRKEIERMLEKRRQKEQKGR